MSTRYTKEELEEYFFEALAMFNDTLESDITSENVVLDFFTPANGLAVYKRFCEKLKTEIFSTDIVWEAAKKMDIIMPDMLYGEKRLQT